MSKVYPGGNRALEHVSLEIDAGDFVVLLGPSGSGKTTLLRCLAGIERISSGSITLDDVVVASGSRHVPPERRDLAMVFQDYALWPHMTVRENVAFALKRRGLGRADRRTAALATLARVGMSTLERRYPSQLSGGEQQRVALARALVGQTQLILFDEPLSNLDANLRERLRIEISSLVRDAGATAVYITHDQAEAFALADRVGVLEQGRLIQLGRPEDIYSSPATPFVARFTGIAGEFAARTCSDASADGTVVVEVDGLPMARPLRARTVLNIGGPHEGLLTIRPTAIELCRHDADEHHLVGTVADVAFRDHGYEHAIDIPGHPRLTGVLADIRVNRGDTVGLRFAPDGCLVFPTEPPQADPPGPAVHTNGASARA